MTATQPEAIAIYQHLEKWWGGPLDGDLIELITNSPLDQLEAAEQDWINLDRLREELMPPVSPGEVRPVYGEWGDFTGRLDLMSARLLLYVDSVVEDLYRLEPFAAMNVVDNPEDWKRNDIRRGLEWLRMMRPLIEEGAIVFTSKTSRILTPQFLELMTNPLPDRVASAQESLGYRLAGNIAIAKDGRGSCLALNADEEVAYKRLLTGQTMADRRISQLTTLARVSLPDFGNSLSSLVTLRKSSDALADWRLHLKRGLAAVAEVPDTERGAHEASTILASELNGSLANVKKAAEASPAMQALRSGTKALGLSGLGAAAGLAAAATMGLPPAGVLVGAASAGAKDFTKAVEEYVTAARKRNEAKAVWGLVMSFTSARSSH
jgi:hypothetical protein